MEHRRSEKYVQDDLGVVHEEVWVVPPTWVRYHLIIQVLYVHIDNPKDGRHYPTHQQNEAYRIERKYQRFPHFLLVHEFQENVQEQSQGYHTDTQRTWKYNPDRELLLSRQV